MMTIAITAITAKAIVADLYVTHGDDVPVPTYTRTLLSLLLTVRQYDCCYIAGYIEYSSDSVMYSYIFLYLLFLPTLLIEIMRRACKSKSLFSCAVIASIDFTGLGIYFQSLSFLPHMRNYSNCVLVCGRYPERCFPKRNSRKTFPGEELSLDVTPTPP